MSDRRQQVIAMAAVTQAATLVERLARTGELNSSDFEPLVKSVFEQDPDNFDQIYGHPEKNLLLGLQNYRQMSSGKGDRISPDTTRYIVALLHLESKLRKDKSMLSALGRGIQKASRQVEHFSFTHESTVGALADLYKDTLSNLSYRIQVTGNPSHLQNERIANQVRTLLLAGIRAAILWRQVGGRRWHLLIFRQQYIEALDQLLKPEA